MVYDNKKREITAEFSTAMVRLVLGDVSPELNFYQMAILIWQEVLTDAEALARVDGIDAIYNDDGAFLTSYTLGTQRIIRHDENATAVWMRITGENVVESPTLLQQQITDSDLARIEAEQRATDLDLQLLEVQNA